MHGQLTAAPRFAIACLIAALGASASSSTVAHHDAAGAGGAGAGTGGAGHGGAGTGAVPCAPEACAADEYCFHPWGCAAGADCSAACPCTCGTLPASCPSTMPCPCPGTGAFGGYFGSPGESFSGPDAGAAYPDHQVACYGS